MRGGRAGRRGSRQQRERRERGARVGCARAHFSAHFSLFGRPCASLSSHSTAHAALNHGLRPAVRRGGPPAPGRPEGGGEVREEGQRSRERDGGALHATPGRRPRIALLLTLTLPSPLSNTATLPAPFACRTRSRRPPGPWGAGTERGWNERGRGGGAQPRERNNDGGRRREAALAFLASRSLLAAPLLPPPTASALALQIAPPSGGAGSWTYARTGMEAGNGGGMGEGGRRPLKAARKATHAPSSRPRTPAPPPALSSTLSIHLPHTQQRLPDHRRRHPRPGLRPAHPPPHHRQPVGRLRDGRVHQVRRPAGRAAGHDGRPEAAEAEHPARQDRVGRRLQQVLHHGRGDEREGMGEGGGRGREKEAGARVVPLSPSLFQPSPSLSTPPPSLASHITPPPPPLISLSLSLSLSLSSLIGPQVRPPGGDPRHNSAKPAAVPPGVRRGAGVGRRQRRPGGRRVDV